LRPNNFESNLTAVGRQVFGTLAAKYDDGSLDSEPCHRAPEVFSPSNSRIRSHYGVPRFFVPAPALQARGYWPSSSSACDGQNELCTKAQTTTLWKRLGLNSTFFVWWDPIFVIWWISTHHSSIKLYGSAHSTYWSTSSYMPDEHIAEARWSILMWKNCYGRLPFDFFGLVFGEKYGFALDSLGKSGPLYASWSHPLRETRVVREGLGAAGRVAGCRLL